MDALADLGRLLGFSLGAGVNLYATVALIGLAQRFEWVALPAQYRVFDHDAVIGLALVLYAVEFLADKVPWVDSVWDAIHSIVRPLGGAFVAVAGLGDVSPTTKILIALVGGTIAASSHATKASARAVVNLSPEPVSNWILSFGEDAFVIGLATLALSYPVAALGVAGLTLVTMAAALVLLIRWLRRWFGGTPPAARSGAAAAGSPG